MREFLTCSLILLFLSACEFEFSVDTPEETIVGTWSSAWASPGDVGYHEKTYFSDGRSCGFFLDGPSVLSPARLATFEGTWRITHGRLISTVVDVSQGTFLTPGEEIVDEVVAITADVLTLRSVDTGRTYNRYRVKDDRQDNLCNLDV